MTAVAERLLLAAIRDFLAYRKSLLINGEWVQAAAACTFATIDPATGNLSTEVDRGEAVDIDRAVRAARKAFDTGPWPSMKSNERERQLRRVGDVLTERAEGFGQLEWLDNGKSAAVATAVDVAWSADVFRYYARWATKIEGSTNVSMPFAPGGECPLVGSTSEG